MKRIARLLLTVALTLTCMAVFSHASFAVDTATMLGAGKAVADETGLTQKATQKAGQYTTQKASKLVNLNTASASELDQIPGIGNKTATAIVDKRTQLGGKFNSVDQLLDVKGIGAKKLEKIKPFLTL
jgi:competence protein ComEA